MCVQYDPKDHRWMKYLGIIGGLCRYVPLTKIIHRNAIKTIQHSVITPFNVYNVSSESK